MTSFFASIRHLGRALMLPIAVLPLAGLLWRLGQPDLLDLPPIAAAGGALFSNLGLLFAVSVAVGLARENRGAAGLASLVGYLIASKGAEVLIQVPPQMLIEFEGVRSEWAVNAYKLRELSRMSVSLGIVSGMVAAALCNRYSELRLVGALSYFGGRRFVPIATGGAGILGAFVFGWGWPSLESAMNALCHAIVPAGPIGLFLYGTLNRLLLVTGLQHLLDNVAWFLAGDFHGVSGDLRRFMSGDPSAGDFMAGYFPVMMFGLPAACLAMYRTAAPERRRSAGGLLLALALSSCLSGITEPVEFTLMFLAPLLFLLHALFTGTAMVVMSLLQVHLGFRFSAGLFDYVLNFDRATEPWLLLPVGAAYFLLYYLVFHFAIVRFNLKTPGRVDDGGTGAAALPEPGIVERTDRLIAALGGATNLRSVDACATRLRLELVNRDAVNARALRRLGARGIVKPGDNGLHIVLGPRADLVAEEIGARLALAPGAVPGVGAAPHQERRAVDRAQATETMPSAQQVINALGGPANIVQVESVAGRVLIRVVDAGLVDEEVLRGLGVRGVAILEPDRVHLLHASAPALEGQLAALLP